jgi:hypothetical protein
VVEQGTHDQLVDAGGAYAALVAMQQAEGGPGGEEDEDEDEGDEENTEPSMHVGGTRGRNLQLATQSSMQLPRIAEASCWASCATLPLFVHRHHGRGGLPCCSGLACSVILPTLMRHAGPRH